MLFAFSLRKIAEKLYNEGYISYPRTETDMFEPNFDLNTLIERQAPDNRWGQFAQNLLNGGFRQPRNGKNNDKAHPPIHPTREGMNLQGDERKVHDFITRRFLACCSENAKGNETNVTAKLGQETFTTHGMSSFLNDCN